jgi:O-antigen/teichoic acid export membrane protein
LSSLKKQGINAFVWDFAGKIVKQGMGFIVSIFLARLLEPSDFGMIAMVMVVIGMATVFTDIGLGSALIQRRRVRPIHYASVFYFNIFVGFVFALLTYFYASTISEFYDNEKLLPLVEVMSLSFIIGALSSVQSTKLRKELNYALLTKIGLISSFVSGVVGVSLAFWGAGVWSLVAQTLSQGIIYNILIWTRANWKPSLQFSWKALRQLWGYGFRMFLSGMLNAIFTRLDYMIIGKLFDPASLGFFQRAKSFNLFIIKYSSGSLMSVLFPVLSKIQRDIPKLQRVVLKSLTILSLITFLLVGGLYVVSQELVVLLFGDKWLPSVMYFKILALSSFSYPLGSLFVSILSSRGKSKAFLRLEIYKKIVCLGSIVVLYMYGIDAFLYALVIQAFINAIWLNITYASREIDLSFWRLFQPILIQMLFAIFSVYLVYYINQTVDFNDFVMLCIKGIEYLVVFVSLNKLFATEAYKNIKLELQPIYNKLLKKVRHDR